MRGNKIRMLSIAYLLILIILFCSSTYAVTIEKLHIEDFLYDDLSMREEIFLVIINNTDKEFNLVLPSQAKNIIVNNINLGENSSIQEYLYCGNCNVSISYLFSNIVINTSSFYQFYRKIDFPIVVNNLSYMIILPENHDLLNTSVISEAIFPQDFEILKEKNHSIKSFYWSYVNSSFPKEFGVRYVLNRKNEKGFDSGLMFVIAAITFFVLSLISVFVIIITKRR